MTETLAASRPIPPAIPNRMSCLPCRQLLPDRPLPSLEGHPRAAQRYQNAARIRSEYCAGRRSLLLHYPSERCQDFVVSSRAEDGASSLSAAPDPCHDQGNRAEQSRAETAEQPFWEVRPAFLHPCRPSLRRSISSFPSHAGCPHREGLAEGLTLTYFRARWPDDSHDP